MGGTVIYMPPEKYEPSATNKSRRADVKHDMYRLDLVTMFWTNLYQFVRDKNGASRVRIIESRCLFITNTVYGTFLGGKV